MTQNEALDKIYYNLLNGGYYGKLYTNMRYAYFDINLTCDGRYIHWNRYGSSANKVTKEDLSWIITKIFDTTPIEFVKEYELRCRPMKYMDEIYDNTKEVTA